MERLLDERAALMLKLHTMDSKSDHRRSLICLCVLAASSLAATCPAPGPTQLPGQSAQVQDYPVQAPQQAQNLPKDVERMQAKLHDYEIRISVLKQQMSTKEQAHEAKVDELTSIVERLHEQMRAAKASSAPTSRGLNARSSAVDRTGRARPYSSAGSFTSLAAGQKSGSLFSPTRLSFFGSSTPFSSGKADPFDGLSGNQKTPQASLKLSHNGHKAALGQFSPNNSSTENTPVKKRIESQSTSIAELGQARSDDNPPKSAQAKPSDPVENTTSTISDLEETYQSANATFNVDALGKKKKNRKIRLFSSEASKLLVNLQSSGFAAAENEDINSIKYYEDDNFKEDNTSPTRPLKRPHEELNTEQPAKRRHVFKI